MTLTLEHIEHFQVDGGVGDVAFVAQLDIQPVRAKSVE